MHCRSRVTILAAAVAIAVLNSPTGRTQQTGSLPEKQAPAASIEAPSSATNSTSEDWTTISLAGSGLPLLATGGVVISKVDQPEYTRELVRMSWRAGDPIDLYVIRPHGKTKPPVIIYLYDFSSGIERFRDDGWCKRAVKDGFAAVGFESAVSGERFHAPRPMKQWFVSELQEALASTTHDVQMILNYLARRDDIDLQHVGMFGQGSGGAVAILAAAADPRIAALDVINPWGDWPDWVRGSRQITDEERSIYLKPEYLAKVATLDPLTYLPRLKTKSVRIQQLQDDPATPQAAREKIAAAAPKPEDVVRYQDATAHLKAYQVSGLSGWLRAQLQPAL